MWLSLAKGIGLRPGDLPMDTRSYFAVHGDIDRRPAESAKYPRRCGGLLAAPADYLRHPQLWELMENQDQRNASMAKYFVDGPAGREAAHQCIAPRVTQYGQMQPTPGRHGVHPTQQERDRSRNRRNASRPPAGAAAAPMQLPCGGTVHIDGAAGQMADPAM